MRASTRALIEAVRLATPVSAQDARTAPIIAEWAYVSRKTASEHLRHLLATGRVHVIEGSRTRGFPRYWRDPTPPPPELLVRWCARHELYGTPSTACERELGCLAARPYAYARTPA